MGLGAPDAAVRTFPECGSRPSRGFRWFRRIGRTAKNGPFWREWWRAGKPIDGFWAGRRVRVTGCRQEIQATVAADRTRASS